jgi:cytochrome P450
MMPPFHGARMRAYGRIMADAAIARAARLAAFEQADMAHVAQDISLEVILRAVFGVERAERVERLRRLVVENLGSFTPPLLYFPFLRRDFGGRGPWRRYLATRAELDRLVQEEIDTRRREEGREDIASLLISARDEDGRPMSDEELRGELRTLLIAGHETSATSIAWALYELHRRPDARRRLEAEIATLGPDPDPEALAKLPYLSAVCEETLRLHPLAPMVIRRLNRPLTLAGRDFAAGTTLAPSMMVAHFDPRLYPAPDAFRPERFLERSYSPFELFPFGGGARRSLGAAFAAYHIRIVLGTLLAHHRFAPAHDRPIGTVMRGMTFGPRGGVPMIHTGRVARPKDASRSASAAPSP